VDPEPGGPKTCGSGSGTLEVDYNIENKQKIEKKRLASKTTAKSKLLKSYR
jgi:hypothetical protein